MSERNRTDRELVDGYRNGCLSDFELLVSRYQDQVYSYVFSLVKDRQLTDDIFQDTFVKIIRTIKAGVYKDEGKFMQFAMRIAHNLVIDHYRRENRIPMVESSSEDYNYVDNAPITDPSVEQGMIVDQIHSDLRGLIERLPIEQKEVLRMRMYDDLSFKEIAEITNVSINTALGRMRYALINLRKMAEMHNICLTY